eukprot:TRINITY_DN12950_c0_g4_i1.p2 TRINITY_DN12950_c0_g4~~TRINITY_DN12950_c0_g4_i1.p2  ORF type:complete len:163 (+),score=12.15 TRINITY_DN12950_c0_g4_i1:23-490(+)
MIRRPPRSTHCISSAASDVYKRQLWRCGESMIVVRVCSGFEFDYWQQPIILLFMPSTPLCIVWFTLRFTAVSFSTCFMFLSSISFSVIFSNASVTCNPFFALVSINIILFFCAYCSPCSLGTSLVSRSDLLASSILTTEGDAFFSTSNCQLSSEL